MHFLAGKYFKVSEDKSKFEYVRAKQNDFSFFRVILLQTSKADFVSFSTFLLYQRPMSAVCLIYSWSAGHS